MNNSSTSSSFSSTQDNGLALTPHTGLLLILGPESFHFLAMSQLSLLRPFHAGGFCGLSASDGDWENTLQNNLLQSGYRIAILYGLQQNFQLLSSDFNVVTYLFLEAFPSPFVIKILLVSLQGSCWPSVCRRLVAFSPWI